MKEKASAGAVFLLVLLVALTTRLGAVGVPLKDFDADEAVVGMMGRDILAGESIPVFYAGQSYLGALEPWSVAASFALFGESALSLRLVPLIYTLAFLVAAYILLRRLFSARSSELVLLWIALGTPYFNLWTVKARGGFPEALLLGTIFILLFEESWQSKRLSRGRLVALGACAGFGLFVNPLVVTMMAVPLVMLVARAYGESRPLYAEAGCRAWDLLLFRRMRGPARVVLLGFAGLGLLILLLAASLIAVGDDALEGIMGVGLPDGTELLAYVCLYLLVLYGLELALWARRQGDGLGSAAGRLWETSAAFQMLVAIGVGHSVVSAVTASAHALLGGGGHDQPFHLAPMVSWPERAGLLFGEIVPTATWSLSGVGGILMAALCIWVAAMLFRERPMLLSAANGPLLQAPISPLLLFGGTTLVTLLLVLISDIARDASAARYLLPVLLSLPATLYVLAKRVATALGGGQIARVGLLGSLTAGLALGSLAGDASVLSPRASGSPYPGLVEEASDRGISSLVSDYWTAYPLAFLSGGDLSVAPADGADRFPAVSGPIRAAGPDAYLFVEGSETLDEYRRSRHHDDVLEEVLRPADGASRYYLFIPER
jgi:hypothetical protein